MENKGLATIAMLLVSNTPPLDPSLGVTSPPDERSPLAVAVEWVARITTVSLEMVLPGLAGQWLDHQLGTSFLVLLGFALGLSVGMWHLLLMTGVAGNKKSDNGKPPREKEP